MPVTAIIGIGLRRLTGGIATVQAKGGTVAEVIDDLDYQFAGFKAAVCTPEGGLQQYVAVFVNGEHVRYRDGVQSAVKDGDQITFLPGAAGG